MLIGQVEGATKNVQQKARWSIRKTNGEMRSRAK